MRRGHIAPGAVSHGGAGVSGGSHGGYEEPCTPDPGRPRTERSSAVHRLLLVVLLFLAVLSLVALGEIESALQIFSILLAHILKLLAR